jgi:hypothetical protein
MDKVTIEVDPGWVARLNSPLFAIVQALSGVSITFAPLFLYWAGSWGLTGPAKWIIIVVCFAIIVTIPGYYMWVASPIIGQLRKASGK